MSQILADQIRHHLTAPGHFPGPGPTAALLAVLDRCEHMRAVSAKRDTPPVIPADVAAAEFEQTIARALGLTN